jgi:uncharacterized protein YuzE
VKFNYYPETDSLYIDLSEKNSMASKELSPGVVADFDENGNIVGLDIDNASKLISLSKIEAKSMPIDAIFLNK